MCFFSNLTEGTDIREPRGDQGPGKLTREGSPRRGVYLFPTPAPTDTGETFAPTTLSDYVENAMEEALAELASDYQVRARAPS